MGIKQHSTYYKDYSIKTYSETVDGIVVLFKRYNKRGKLLHNKNSEGWQRYAWRLINGKDYQTSSKNDKGIWWKRKFDNNGRMIYEEDNTGFVYDYFVFKKDLVDGKIAEIKIRDM